MQPDILNDFHYRSSFQDALIIQIRSDYSLCRRLWDIAEKRVLTEPEINLLEKSFAWLKRSLEQYRKLQREKIQGRIDGDIMDIQQNILRNKSVNVCSFSK